MKKYRAHAQFNGTIGSNLKWHIGYYELRNNKHIMICDNYRIEILPETLEEFTEER